MFPPHITETARRLIAEREKYIVVPVLGGGCDVVTVDELREVKFHGRWRDCVHWVECKALSAALVTGEA